MKRKNDEVAFTQELTDDLIWQIALCDEVGILMTDFEHQQHKKGHIVDILATEVIAEKELNNSYMRGVRRARRIAIEAQLGKTNGSHSTKLGAYMHAYDAQIGILIAEAHSEKWADFLRALNEEGSGRVYYLVMVVRTSIQPIFTVVCRPDKKAEAASLRAAREAIEKTPKQLSEMESVKKYAPFREGLVRYFEANSNFRLKDSYRHFVHIPVGTSSAKRTVDLEMLFTQRWFTTGLRIKGVECARALYEGLLEKRDLIEAEVGEQLVWDPKPGKKSMTISFIKRNGDCLNLREAKAHYATFLAQCERLHPVMVKYLELVKAEQKVMA